MKKSRAKPSGFGATSKKDGLNPQGSGLLQKKKSKTLRVQGYLKKRRAKPSGFRATSKKEEPNPQGSGYPEKKWSWPLRVLQGGELCKLLY